MAQPPVPRTLFEFPTHIVSEAWPLAATHGPALRDAILARGGAADSDKAACDSDAAQALREYVMHRADTVVHDKVQQGDTRRFIWSTTMSAMRVQQGASVPPVGRPGAILSAVYHLDDGYAGSDDPALGGEILFVDPRYPTIRMGSPDLRFRRPDGSADHHELLLRPISGQILIFPAWLAHGVRPFRGAGVRLSIAVHLSMRLLP